MVLKPMERRSRHDSEFENDVKTYGTETTGSQIAFNMAFENDVKTYGTETGFSALLRYIGLRMM